MSRHNRRRTRGGNKAHNAPIPQANFELPSCPKADPMEKRFSAPPLHTFTRRGDISARHWHNRYIAWQTREGRQREERKRLMEDRKRIFGGESDENDEDEICSKMMEYFNGLDYIDLEL